MDKAFIGTIPDGQGPHRSRDEAVRKAEWAAGMGRLDAADVVDDQANRG